MEDVETVTVVKKEFNNSANVEDALESEVDPENSKYEDNEFTELASKMSIESDITSSILLNATHSESAEIDEFAPLIIDEDYCRSDEEPKLPTMLDSVSSVEEHDSCRSDEESNLLVTLDSVPNMDVQEPECSVIEPSPPKLKIAEVKSLAGGDLSFDFQPDNEQPSTSQSNISSVFITPDIKPKIDDINNISPEFITPDINPTIDDISDISTPTSGGKIKIVPLSKLTDTTSKSRRTSILIDRLKRSHVERNSSVILEKRSREESKINLSIPSTSTQARIGSSRRKSLLVTRNADDNDKMFLTNEKVSVMRAISPPSSSGRPEIELMRNVAFLRICVNHILTKIGKKPIVFERINPTLAVLIQKYAKS